MRPLKQIAKWFLLLLVVIAGLTTFHMKLSSKSLQSILIMESALSIDPIPEFDKEMEENNPVNSNETLRPAKLRPCLTTNDQILLTFPDLKKWPEADIIAHRDDWKSWLVTKYPKQLTYQKAMDLMQKRGGWLPQPRGIVIVFTPDLMPWLRTNLWFLRKHGCQLPIEVWCFKSEITASQIKEVEALGNNNSVVSVRFADDTRLYLPIERGNEGRNYHVKIVAIANTAFENVLMLDVDVLSFKNPEFLFESEEFKQFGALFWPDFWRTSIDSPAWKWMDHPCVDEREQESGMIFMNRPSKWKALNLLWYLSRNQEIRDWHDFLNGDKVSSITFTILDH
ncbi:hypothetical protein HK096_010665 [Nowakowskiella sp. JEL0078]|nr:hypothetical protein HK096_010665 [Nowakowskiella sp. JEL0078]